MIALQAWPWEWLELPGYWSKDSKCSRGRDDSGGPDAELLYLWKLPSPHPCVAVLLLRPSLRYQLVLSKALSMLREMTVKGDFIELGRSPMRGKLPHVHKDGRS